MVLSSVGCYVTVSSGGLCYCYQWHVMLLLSVTYGTVISAMLCYCYQWHVMLLLSVTYYGTVISGMLCYCYQCHIMLLLSAVLLLLSEQCYVTVISSVLCYCYQCHVILLWSVPCYVTVISAFTIRAVKLEASFNLSKRFITQFLTRSQQFPCSLFKTFSTLDQQASVILTVVGLREDEVWGTGKEGLSEVLYPGIYKLYQTLSASTSAQFYILWMLLLICCYTFRRNCHPQGTYTNFVKNYGNTIVLK